MTEPKSMHCGRAECKGFELPGGEIVYMDCICTCGACREARNEFLDCVIDTVIEGPPICTCDSNTYCHVHPPEKQSDN